MGGQHNDSDEIYGQAAGAIGVLIIAFGALAAVKDKLGLSWPAAVLLVAGVLVALGYLAWRLRTLVVRLMKSSARPAPAPAQAPATNPGETYGAVEAVPAHPELTGALSRAGAIGRDEVVRADEATTETLPVGTVYDFLMPQGRTHEDVAKRLGSIASMFGVTRLHLKLETSRHSERRVRLLKLDQPPFTRPFPAPTRQEITAFDGVPLGHDVTGRLAGVPTFDKASLLIGGMTQMGKTTLVNGLITCLLVAYGDFDLYLLDGKLCGLTRFEKVAARYESSDDPAVLEDMLDELNARVDGRYQQLQDAVRSRQPAPEFRPVFFIIDEAADFYSDDGARESKEQVRRVVEKSRSLVAKALESGISTVMLTQRPAKDAIPVKVRDQFLYRMCLYVASEGSAKVALGDSYFDTVAPIHPALLDPHIKGQAVLFANGASTLIRGFHFPDDFIWDAVDEVHQRQKARLDQDPDGPLKQAIALMQRKGVEFLPTPELAPALGITETDPTQAGKQLNKLLGVAAHRGAKGVRGYRLADLTAAAMSDS